MMFSIQKFFPVFGSIIITGFAACSSTKNLSAVNISSGPRFIDGIEVHANGSHARHTTQSTNIIAPKKDFSENRDDKNIAAHSSSLQIKYAAMLNTIPAQLRNTNLLQTIDEWYGVPYRYGGTTKSGIDCSAFSQTVIQAVYNRTLPRTAQEQFDSRLAIDKEDLQEGDLIFFHTSGRRKDITHVGVYLANDKFVHASLSNGVSIADLDDPYWKASYRGAGRHS
ncbi:MAG: C40 family peptidase [Chitinophagaceae bacterium]|jgi:lipoprotein Spr|nr:C40 family peptidase [Chitinophagaceae bacterium]